MNFEDEAYVRVYKRKTITFKRLGWEGRTVLWHLMLEADRAGIIEVGEGDLVEAVTVLVDLPEDVVSSGLSRLSSQGVTERHGTSLVITRFIEAQEATRSDKARAREYRERRRSETSRTVTAESQSVTTASRAVTTSHGASLSTDQVSEEKKDPPTPLPVRTERKDPFADSLTGKSPRDRADVLALFDDWKLEFGFVEAKLCVGIWSADADTLAAAIDAYGLETCRIVLRHAKNDGMVSGRDDEKRQKHESIAYIFENQNTFQRILRDARKAEGSGKTVQQRMAEARSR